MPNLPGSRDCAHRVAGRLLRGVATTVLLALSLSACSDDGSSVAEVRSFDEVRASDIVVESDTSDPSRGVFRVTTSEPMICAVVWGTDGSYGRFNNSLSMNGTGIEQHDVILPDVQPGVTYTYTYIVQGTTADGTLYRSKPATFRVTAPTATGATPAPALGTNIAPRATVTAVSSDFSASFAGTKAIDEQTTTEWATRGDGDAGFITLDLGAVADVKGIEFVTRSMADGTAITTTYTVSVDGGAPVGPFAAATVAVPRPAAVNLRGWVLRFDIAASSDGNVGAVEVRVFV